MNVELEEQAFKAKYMMIVLIDGCHYRNDSLDVEYVIPGGCQLTYN